MPWRYARVLWDDYGVSAPNDPLAFDVNADYGAHGSSASSIYHGLSDIFDLAATEVVTTPAVEGSMKSIEHRKVGFVGFPELEAPPPWLETEPKIDFFRKLRTEFLYDYGEEMPLVAHAFAWTEKNGHCIENVSHAWTPENGWQSNQWKDVQNYTDETWQWWRDIPEAPENWYLHDYSGLYLETYEIHASGDPPSLPNNSVVGEWTTDTPTLRIGSGAEHSTGTQVTKPTPGAGYSPAYRTSETFSLTQELSEPYSTNDLIVDAYSALAAAPASTVNPVASRNLVENETKISLAGGQYRLTWTIPANTPLPPGYNQVKAVFVWKELTDPEADPNSTPNRSVDWKSEAVQAAPGSIAQTRWYDLPPPQNDGTRWISPATPNGSISFPNAILVNKDDDDGNLSEDSAQLNLSFAMENDLIPLSFDAKPPGPDETALIYRLEASGAGKVRLWQVFPNQAPQLLPLPYRLQERDYTGSTLPRPDYFLDATSGGTVTLNLHAEVLGKKLALVATTKSECLDLSIAFASGMRGVIGDIVPSNIAPTQSVHFVTIKSANPADTVDLTITGVNSSQIAPLQADQKVEWVGAFPNTGNPTDAKVSRSATGKFPVTARVIATGQTLPDTNVWVTWASLSLEDSTPVMRPAADITDINGQIIGINLSGKIVWRYDCEPTSMFDRTQDTPTFNVAPSVPAPGIHPWTGDPLAPGAAISYDASRQVRVIMRSNDETVQLALHSGTPDIISYPADSIEGNDDPNMSGETTPYLPHGITAIMLDRDFPFIQLNHSIGNGNPNATIQKVAQFKQFARIQIGSKWHKCSADELAEITLRLRRENEKWVDDGSTFNLGNSIFPPP